jgi:uncharacterized membrane protein HdeD (DUF308 family)
MADPRDDELAKKNQAKSAKDDESLKWLFAGLGMILFSGLMCYYLLFVDNKFSGVEKLITLFLCVFGIWFGIKRILNPITAVGERGNANRSALMIIGFFLLILVVIVFGTILVLK